MVDGDGIFDSTSQGSIPSVGLFGRPTMEIQESGPQPSLDRLRPPGVAENREGAQADTSASAQGPGATKHTSVKGSRGSGKKIILEKGPVIGERGVEQNHNGIMAEYDETPPADETHQPDGAVWPLSKNSKSIRLPLSVSALERCLAAAVKGFVIGAGLKGGLALFGILGRLRRQVSGSRSQNKALATITGRAVSSALKETLRFGLFLGTYAGGYCCVDELIAAVGGLKRTARWRPLLAGAAAGPALLLTGRDTGHTSMALYVLLRATVLGARCGIKSSRWGWLFRPLTWQHGDALLMCISSSQILYAWIVQPHSLPASYISFLNKHGGKDTRIVAAINEMASPERPLERVAAVEAVYREKGRKLYLDPYMQIPCQMLHPHQWCLSHFCTFLGKAYLRAIPVYLPVYVIPALLVHRKALLHRPLPILSKTAVGAARSSFFLAFYCASAWLWTCSIHQLFQRCSGATVAAGTFPVGLAVLFEKKSRRMELALYCLSRAIESFGICAAEWGWLQSLRGFPKRLDVAMFSLATAVIMHCYNNERDVFRSKYLNVLDWVFGVPPILSYNKQTPRLQTVEKGRMKVWEAAR